MTDPWNIVSGVDIDGDFTQSLIGSRVDGDVIQKQYRFMRGQPSWYLGPEEVARLLACYVPARNHEDIVRLLRQSHAVVLTGHQGCGRSTTAIAAMNKLLPGIPIRRFVLDQEEVDEIGSEGACGYLVRAADGSLDRLGGCVDAVRASGGFLAVIADDKPADLGTVVAPSVPVEPPPPVSVYRRWVTTHHRLPGWASWERAGVLLRDVLPADARRLADLCAEAEEKGRSLEERQAEAEQAYLGWNKELGDWFKKYEQPQDRTLLIAAATLPSAVSKDYIYAAAALLAQALRVDVNGAGLAWWPVTGLPAMLRASPDDSEISFHRVGFPGAVLRHALADYPLAHDEVLSWLGQLPAGVAAEYKRGREAAETFADLAAERGAADHVIRMAKQWEEENPAELAFIVLSRTSLHPLIGGRVRQALREWSRNAKTAQPLKLVIAQVCELIGEEYPSVALTRLKHLATKGNFEVLREVISTAMTLAGNGHREVVTAAALQWCDADASRERLSARERQRRRRAGATLFLGLAGTGEPPDFGLPPVPAETRYADLRPIVQAWRAVFEFLDTTMPNYHDAVETTICRWLEYALSHDTALEQVCDVFADAAYPAEGAPSTRTDGTAARTMIDIVRWWAAGDRGDMTRTSVERLIVVPLTFPWWLRLIRRLVLDFRRYRQARGMGSRLSPFGIKGLVC